jgi:hypothetical protein
MAVKYTNFRAASSSKITQIRILGLKICHLANIDRWPSQTVRLNFLPGLPDGLFSNQKSEFGYNFEGLRMDYVGIFYSQLVYFVAIWYSLWLFGMFFPVLVLCAKKNLATLFSSRNGDVNQKYPSAS